MDYFNIGDPISYNKYNALVYLLRKFKRLNSKLRLGQSNINDDYGTYNILGGLKSIEGNWILEDDVNIISNNCLLNCEYTFTFTIIDVNTSGRVNKREKSFTGLTGETGTLNITIPEDTINSDEQILSDFRLDIIFDEHEKYTPFSDIHISLSANKKFIGYNESATVTATVTDGNNTPLEDYTVNFNVNGTITSKTTDSSGKATITITGAGDTGLITINALTEKITIIDAYYYDYGYQQTHNDNWWNQNNEWFKEYLQESTLLQHFTNSQVAYAPSKTDEYGITPNLPLELSTRYCIEFDLHNTSGQLYCAIGNPFQFIDFYTYHLIETTGHYKIVVDSDKVEYWVDNNLIVKSCIIDEDTNFFFVCIGSAEFEFANFVVYNLNEPGHDYSLSLTGTSIIQSGDSDTITATLLDNGVAVAGETLNYEIKHGSTVIDSGSGVTDANGELDISYTGTGVGDVEVIVSFGMSLQETYEVTDADFYDIPSSDKSSEYISKVGSANITTNVGNYVNMVRTSSSIALSSPISINTGTNYKITLDGLVVEYNRVIFGIGLVKQSDNTKYLVTGAYNNNWSSYYYYSGTFSQLFQTSQSQSNNTWYSLELEIDNGDIVFKAYDNNGNLLNTNTASLPSDLQNTDVNVAIMSFANNTDVRYKNIIVKKM